MTDRARRTDILLYGTALALSLAGIAYSLVRSTGSDTSAQPPALSEPVPPRAMPDEALVPSLPRVPDLAREPPPPRPPADDGRMASLGAEMRYLGRARELLAEQPTEAYALLEQHRRDHPQGILREEREAFAIEALSSLDRHAEAERRYYDFRRVYSHSGFTERLSALLR